MKNKEFKNNNTENVPIFIKKFSKENPDIRKKLFELIKHEKNIFFKNKKNNQKDLKEVGEKIEKTIEEVEKIEKKIEEEKERLLDTPWYKFKTKEQIAQVIEDIEYGTIEEEFNDGLSNKKIDLNYFKERKNQIEGRLDIKYDLPEKGSKKIKKFYEYRKEEWKESDFSPEDIKTYFSDEILEKLTIKEYLLLRERFPSAVQTHSIRQGIRDHVGRDSMGFARHNIGEKKYFNNFKNILHDKYLKNTINLFLGDPITKESVKNFINQNDHNFSSEEAKINYLKKLSQERGLMRDFEDNMAIHFGTNVVLDKFYGSEKGNEIFIIFPSAYIASQHHFSGDLNSGFEHMAYNDNQVWSKKSEGIPINSGIVFIPKNAQVDERNGSKYLLDKNNKPILNNEELQLAKNTISSQRYWENYFQQNPEKKPKRIFYYEGETGTEGLNNIGKVFKSEKINISNNRIKKINENKTYSDPGFNEIFSENRYQDNNKKYYKNKKRNLIKILKELEIID